METPSGDVAASSPSPLQQKYGRLATEYAKMRAQLGVLKKAVLDEQEKAWAADDRLKEKDQTLRKKEAEMDSLTFRNQQMARRVEILQEEAENLNRHKRPARASPAAAAKDVSASESLNSVMGEELQLKIAENARLHAALDGVDEKYLEQVQRLQSEIGALEGAAAKREQHGRAGDSRLKDLVQGLKADNAGLTVRVRELQQEIVDRNDAVTLLKAQLDPSTNGTSRTRGIPLTAVDARVQSVEVVSQVGESVQNVVAGLSDLHTYWEHRLKDSGRRLNDSGRRLSELLMGNVGELKPVEQSFQDLLSGLLSSGDNRRFDGRSLLRDAEPFAKALSGYVRYAVQEVEPLMVVTLQQESNATSCTPTQQAKNGQLVSQVRAFDRTLERLSGHVGELAGAEGSDGRTPADVLDSIAVALSQLHQESAELHRVYKAKADDEDRQPTTSEQLKNTNQCIVAAMSGLAAALNGASRHVTDNLESIGALVVADFECDDVPDAEEVNKPSEDAMPSSDASLADELKDELCRATEEASRLEERLKKAEQAKEHWKLEFQLLKMKHDKVCNNAEDGGAGDDDGERRKVYESRIDDLVAETLLADGKAAHFYLECAALTKRIRSRDSDRREAEDNLKAALDEMESLREEAATLASNYDSQLAMMTEHVASLNDQLTRKTDEIERLGYELAQARKHKK